MVAGCGWLRLAASAVGGQKNGSEAGLVSQGEEDGLGQGWMKL